MVYGWMLDQVPALIIRRRSGIREHQGHGLRKVHDAAASDPHHRIGLTAGGGSHPLRQFIHILGFGFHIGAHKEEKVLFLPRKLGHERLPFMNVVDHENHRRAHASGLQHITELGIAAAAKHEIGHDSKISVHRTSLTIM